LTHAPDHRQSSAGADALTIQEVGPEGKRQVIRIELTVK
jgi:hypothetical protein